MKLKISSLQGRHKRDALTGGSILLGCEKEITQPECAHSEQNSIPPIYNIYYVHIVHLSNVGHGVGTTGSSAMQSCTCIFNLNCAGMRAHSEHTIETMWYITQKQTFILLSSQSQHAHVQSQYRPEAQLDICNSIANFHQVHCRKM